MSQKFYTQIFILIFLLSSSNPLHAESGKERAERYCRNWGFTQLILSLGFIGYGAYAASFNQCQRPKCQAEGGNIKIACCSLRISNSSQALAPDNNCKIHNPSEFEKNCDTERCSLAYCFLNTSNPELREKSFVAAEDRLVYEVPGDMDGQILGYVSLVGGAVAFVISLVPLISYYWCRTPPETNNPTTSL